MGCGVDMIIGKNASGKTKILRDDLNSCIERGLICAANFSEGMPLMLQKMQTDEQLVDEVNSMLDFQKLVIIGESVAVEIKIKCKELEKVSE